MRFDITDPLPRGTTVLQASAGTGKTWAIAALTARMVAEEGLEVKDLLIVTFTRPATRELRLRIRQRLVEVARVLRRVLNTGRLSERDDGDPLRRILTIAADGSVLAPEELTARLARVRTAITDIDSADIMTIHSFCRTALGGLGVAGEVAGSFPLVENTDELLSEVVDDVYLAAALAAGRAPAFSHAEAVMIARAVVGNPSAVIRPSLEDDVDDEARARCAFAVEVRAVFQRRKAERGILTHDDSLTILADLLGSAGPEALDARSRLRDRWRHVLVDEFQDTDDIQWRILRSVFDGAVDFTLIGDPKQAIYSFRGGDITTYLSATQGRRSLTLAHNFRSDAGLVAGLNEFLGGMELGHPAITVKEVEVGKAQDDVLLAPGHHRLRLRVLDGDSFFRRGRSAPAADALRAAIARDVAEDVAALLSAGHRLRIDGGTRPAQARDIGVLCRRNKDAEQIHQALAAKGINAVIAGGRSVFDSEAAEDWLTLLDAMDGPSNTRAVNAVALTPFFGRSAVELLEQPEETAEVVAAGLRRLTRALTEGGPAAVFNIAQGQDEGGMAARLLSHMGGERRFTDLRHISELMQEAHPRANAHTLGAWLRRERDRASGTENLRRLESEDSAVQIYTIHSAKGLEFPFVYLPTLPMESLSNRFPHTFHLDSGERAVAVVKSAEFSALAKAEQEAEWLRLLYVAFTRAIGQVTTYWAPQRSIKANAFHRLLTRRGSPTDFDARTPVDEVVERISADWGAVLDVSVVSERNVPGPSQPRAPEIGPARTWTRTVDQHWRRSSYTSLSTRAQEQADPGGVEQEFKEDPGEVELARAMAEPSRGPAHVPSPMADLPRGARFGSLVHAILETVDARAADMEAEVAQRVEEALHYWPQDLDADLLIRAVLAVLDTPLHPALSATLSDLDPAQTLAELDFELPLAGGIHARGGAGSAVTLRGIAPLLREHLALGDPLRPYADVLDSPAYEIQELRGYLTGSIDLVFRHGGKFYVADYKTNWLGPVDEPNTTAPYDAAGVTRAMEGSSYPLQALLYTVALHRYLRWRLPTYSPGEHLGGVLYLYVRGMAGASTPVVDGHSTGVFFWSPPPALIEGISELLDGEEGAARDHDA